VVLCHATALHVETLSIRLDPEVKDDCQYLLCAMELPDATPALPWRRWLLRCGA
jgi:hypothetical protein